VDVVKILTRGHSSLGQMHHEVQNGPRVDFGRDPWAAVLVLMAESVLRVGSGPRASGSISDLALGHF
jgi:hypothetical protein